MKKLSRALPKGKAFRVFLREGEGYSWAGDLVQGRRGALDGKGRRRMNQSEHIGALLTGERGKTICEIRVETGSGHPATAVWVI